MSRPPRTAGRPTSSFDQINESLLKVICHNLCCLIHEMHESGVVAEFCTKTITPAQQIGAAK
jgi:hypothetical protein